MKEGRKMSNRPDCRDCTHWTECDYVERALDRRAMSYRQGETLTDEFWVASASVCPIYKPEEENNGQVQQ